MFCVLASEELPKHAAQQFLEDPKATCVHEVCRNEVQAKSYPRQHPGHFTSQHSRHQKVCVAVDKRPPTSTEAKVGERYVCEVCRTLPATSTSWPLAAPSAKLASCFLFFQFLFAYFLCLLHVLNVLFFQSFLQPVPVCTFLQAATSGNQLGGFLC